MHLPKLVANENASFSGGLSPVSFAAPAAKLGIITSQFFSDTLAAVVRVARSEGRFNVSACTLLSPQVTGTQSLSE
jgi:hypothetical protein